MLVVRPNSQTLSDIFSQYLDEAKSNVEDFLFNRTEEAYNNMKDKLTTAKVNIENKLHQKFIQVECSINVAITNLETAYFNAEDTYQNFLDRTIIPNKVEGIVYYKASNSTNGYAIVNGSSLVGGVNYNIYSITLCIKQDITNTILGYLTMKLQQPLKLLS